MKRHRREQYNRFLIFSIIFFIVNQSTSVSSESSMRKEVEGGPYDISSRMVMLRELLDQQGIREGNIMHEVSFFPNLLNHELFMNFARFDR